FVLMYLYDSPAAQPETDSPADPLQDLVVSQTSIDGVSWTAPQVWLKSVDSPNVSSGPSGGILPASSPYYSGNIPAMLDYKFSIDPSTGNLNFTSVSTDWVPQGYTPATGLSESGIGSPQMFWLAQIGGWPLWSNLGKGDVYLSATGDVPIYPFSYTPMIAST